MSEAINDSSRLLAQALEKLRSFEAETKDIIQILEQALDKLLTEK